jgi:hypothetical protein
MVGYQVKTEVDKISYVPDTKFDLEFNLDLGGTSKATILVRDDLGNIVYRKEVTKKELEESNGKVTMEQTNYSNNSSRYTVEIESTNKNAFLYNVDTITGVLNKNGVPQLRSGSSTIDVSKIIELKAA